MSKLFECSVFLNMTNEYGELIEKTEVARVRNKNYANLLVKELDKNEFDHKYYRYTIEER